MDKHTPEQRRKNMQAVKHKDSQIELLLRKELWSRGLRYRKNVNRIYGKPDIVFIGKKVAVFCDTEFWHGYHWRERKKDFKSHQEFWITKKLDQIEEAQKDIIEFLQLKEKAVLKGNIAVLQEILDEYKYNWDNDKYKNNKHIINLKHIHN